MLLDENNIRLAHSVLPELAFKSLINLRPAELAELLQQNKIYSTKEVSPIVALNEFQTQLNNSDSEAMFETKLTSLHDINRTAENYVVVKHLNYLPWKLVGAQPQDVFDAPIMKQQSRAIWLATGIVGVVVIFSFLLTQIISAKVKKS